MKAKKLLDWEGKIINTCMSRSVEIKRVERSETKEMSYDENESK